MWSKLALLIVLIQDGVIVAAQMRGAYPLLRQMLVYGSPVSLFMHLFGVESVLSDTLPVMVLIAAAHLFKYFTFAMAQIRDEAGGMLYTAVLLEAAYLAYSAYWIM